MYVSGSDTHSKIVCSRECLCREGKCLGDQHFPEMQPGRRERLVSECLIVFAENFSKIKQLIFDSFCAYSLYGTSFY